MSLTKLELIALEDVPMVESGDDVTAIVRAGLERANLRLDNQDVVIVAQKIISKAEGRRVDLADVTVSARARELAEQTEKDPRVVELILSEARRVVRARPGLIIVEHHLGLVMANAGIDLSNTGGADGRETALLLPLDPDQSAANLQGALADTYGAGVGVIISDSFGRPWRSGTTGVAIGAAGLPGLLDLRGEPDLNGRPLMVSISGFADEIAAAASLLMGQGNEGRPIVIARGLSWSEAATNAAALMRPPEQDLFR